MTTMLTYEYLRKLIGHMKHEGAAKLRLEEEQNSPGAI
jgi:solute carrier family 25 folate transporter 32